MKQFTRLSKNEKKKRYYSHVLKIHFKQIQRSPIRSASALIGLTVHV